MTGRQRTATEYNALKTAVKRLLADVGGIDAAAACTRGSRSLFSDYGSVASDRHIPADALLDLETIGGVPHVTAALAASHGYELVRIGAPQAAERIATALSRIGQGMGTLFGDASHALSGDGISDAEYVALTADLEECGRLVTDALAVLRFQRNGGSDA